MGYMSYFNRLTVGMGLAATFTVIALTGCSKEASAPASDKAPAAAQAPAAPAATNAAAVVTPYPLKTCIVSGEKLGGDMGEPVTFVYNNQEIKFCCAMCKPKFLKDPDAYMKKIKEAEAKN